MLKGEQELKGFKTYKKEVTQKKHVNAEIKQTKLGFLGNGIMHTRTSLHTQNQACMCKLDHA